MVALLYVCTIAFFYFRFPLFNHISIFLLTFCFLSASHSKASLRRVLRPGDYALRRRRVVVHSAGAYENTTFASTASVLSPHSIANSSCDYKPSETSAVRRFHDFGAPPQLGFPATSAVRRSSAINIHSILVCPCQSSPFHLNTILLTSSSAAALPEPPLAAFAS